MLVIDNQLCYSPEPPRNYAWRHDGNIPQGPLMGAVDRATGCAFLKANGAYHDDIAQGLAPWNLTFLLTQEADALPEAIRQRNTKAGAAFLQKFPFQTVERSHGLYIFAGAYADWLLERPLRFMEKVRKQKIELPCGADFVTVLKRAEAIDDMAPRAEGNVVRVNCWRRA